MPYNMIYLALHLLLSKLYANSLLATLNYRQVQHARRMSQSEGGAHPLSSTRSMRADATLPYSVKDCFVPTPEVHVETTVVSDASGATAVNKRWSAGESSIDKDPSKQKTSGPGVRVDEVNEPTNESYCSL
ncbi:hypothetical protein WOLCODRAFT_137147 [Wolfiporia cocos MD-104 SS10]|uniref:Uncharacterized protein n=1 Tax=Wolfiporia cocos (strain MD-104) TaxID=742152 RepID=A0A2H3JFR4_WOLCO|nr:hypothetical protein WOLCODRAFT_137147 [Wolfiporia cocos MD-104 SS10]